MSIVELILAMSLFSVLTLGATQSMRLLSQERGSTTAAARLDSRIFEAAKQIADDIRRSGATSDSTYPHMVDDPSAPGAGFLAHIHEAPTDFGAVNREVIFVHVADLDDNDVPDIDPDGGLVWGTEEFSYVLVPSILGRNQIERHVDGQLDRVIARHVESMTFDDATSSGGEVPSGYLRLRIAMSVDVNGQTVRREVERMVHLIQEID